VQVDQRRRPLEQAPGSDLKGSRQASRSGWRAAEPIADNGYVYRIEHPQHQPFATSNEPHAIEHLNALGIEDPERRASSTVEGKIEIHGGMSIE
jgi:hypothetical protein